MKKLKEMDITTKMCVILKKQGLSYSLIAKKINEEVGSTLDSQGVLYRLRWLRRKYGEDYLNNPQISESINNFSQALKDAGLNPDSWSHGWLKVDGASIFVKNKDGLMTYDQIRDELVQEMKSYAPKYPKLKRTRVENPHLLVIDPADVHIGKLAMSAETGSEYNIEIAVQRCVEGVRGIMNKVSTINFDKVVLIIGNDILHIDTPFRKTTAGTPQDTDRQWWYMFQEAKKLYVKLIEELLTVADVHVIYNPSNHDFTYGFMLADAVSSWFAHSKSVTFDVDMVHRKYFKYGSNLIGTSHGDGAKENDLPLLMASEVPKLWAETVFRYIYLHHIHHKKTIKWQSGKDYHGATVEYLRTPSEADGWHDRNGYTAVPKAIEAFVHHPDEGQVMRITHYF